jgi:hypothetical protein
MADHLPASVNGFFQSLKMNCFPEAEGMTTKAQPWRQIRAGPQQPSKDGKLLVACPKNCQFGRFYSLSIYNYTLEADEMNLVGSGSGLGGY